MLPVYQLGVPHPAFAYVPQVWYPCIAGGHALSSPIPHGMAGGATPRVVPAIPRKRKPRGNGTSTPLERRRVLSRTSPLAGNGIDTSDDCGACAHPARRSHRFPTPRHSLTNLVAPLAGGRAPISPFAEEEEEEEAMEAGEAQPVRCPARVMPHDWRTTDRAAARPHARCRRPRAPAPHAT